MICRLSRSLVNDLDSVTGMAVNVYLLIPLLLLLLRLHRRVLSRRRQCQWLEIAIIKQILATFLDRRRRTQYAKLRARW